MHTNTLFMLRPRTSDLKPPLSRTHSSLLLLLRSFSANSCSFSGPNIQGVILDSSLSIPPVKSDATYLSQFRSSGPHPLYFSDYNNLLIAFTAINLLSFFQPFAKLLILKDQCDRVLPALRPNFFACFSAPGDSL